MYIYKIYSIICVFVANSRRSITLMRNVCLCFCFSVLWMCRFFHYYFCCCCCYCGCFLLSNELTNKKRDRNYKSKWERTSQNVFYIWAIKRETNEHTIIIIILEIFSLHHEFIFVFVQLLHAHLRMCFVFFCSAAVFFLIFHIFVQNSPPHIKIQFQKQTKKTRSRLFNSVWIGIACFAKKSKKAKSEHLSSKIGASFLTGCDSKHNHWMNHFNQIDWNAVAQKFTSQSMVYISFYCILMTCCATRINFN